MVQPIRVKSILFLYQGEEGLVHFQWLDRNLNVVEDVSWFLFIYFSFLLKLFIQFSSWVLGAGFVDFMFDCLKHAPCYESWKLFFFVISFYCCCSYFGCLCILFPFLFAQLILLYLLLTGFCSIPAFHSIFVFCLIMIIYIHLYVYYTHTRTHIVVVVNILNKKVLQDQIVFPDEAVFEKVYFTWF